MSYILETHTFNPEKLPLEETLFHTANGYLGVRGNFEEGYSKGVKEIRGSYVNGFFDTHPIHHPEKLYGFSTVGEKILNVTDAQGVSVGVDGESMILGEKNHGDYRRFLDMKRGVTGRGFTWKGENGKRIRADISRIVSFVRREVFAIEYKITALDSAVLTIRSTVRARVSNYFDAADPRVSGEPFAPLEVVSKETDQSGVILESRAKNFGLRLWTCVNHRLGIGNTGYGRLPDGIFEDNDETVFEWSLEMSAGESLTLTKIARYADSRMHDDCPFQFFEARELLEEGFASLVDEQEIFLRRFWEEAGITIEGDDHTLEALRFNLFCLLQSSSRDSSASIPAKGLSGEGYEGHYFWDTETYMLPLFLYTRPQIARSLLEFRYATLPGAREHAKEMGHARGAAFPWRTITGRECSAYYPSGSAQYHINADIAYAVWRYWEATEDDDFIVEYGAEILFETARIWMEVGNFTGDEFHIHTVTGPDEYTCLINDNYFTNRMAQKNLTTALSAYTLLESQYGDALSNLKRRINLEDDEPASWKAASEAMVILYDRERDVNPQDSSFLSKPVWDFAATPEDHYPLLLHYHHMTLSRHQVCKQADTVLAYVLLGDDGKNPTVRNSFEYYEKVTTHDSSLSYAAFSIMAARLGDAEKAYEYFSKTATLDLDDTHGNTKDGIHAANMGGTWLAVVWGFGGFRPQGTMPSFSPILPRNWESLGFRIRYGQSAMDVRADRKGVTLHLVDGPSTDVEIYGTVYNLEDKISVPSSGT